MTGRRALLRLAVRDARRDRWRTLLVVLFVALPVAALVATIALADAAAPTGPEQATRVMGQADAVAFPTIGLEIEEGIELEGPDGTAAALEDLRSRLLGEVVAEPVSRGSLGVVLPSALVTQVKVTDARLDDDALAAGRFLLLDGRPPITDEEAVVTRALADVAGVDVGEALRLEDGTTLQVVGLSERPEQLREQVIHVSAAAPVALSLSEVLLATPDGQVPAPTDGVRGRFRGRFAEPMPDPELAPDEGAPRWLLETRADHEAERLGDAQRAVAVVVAGLAVVEVALIAGASFAVSVRRRQRELGLLAAVGGGRRHVRQVVLLLGATTGVVGAALGVVVGLGLAVAAVPWFDTLVNRRTGGVVLDPLWLLVSAGIGVMAATLGALWPARSVSRLPTTVALSGRRPVPDPPRRLLLLGLALVTVGVLTCLVAVLPADRTGLPQHVAPWLFLPGCVLLVLGTGLTSPWLLEQAGRLAPRLPLGLRLAVRDAARYRTRNGPLVTAAMAALAASISMTAAVASTDDEAVREHRPLLGREQLIVVGDAAGAVTSALANRLDGTATAMIGAPGMATVMNSEELEAGADGSGWPAVGTPELAALVGGHDAVVALEQGLAVVLTADQGRTGTVTVRYSTVSAPGREREVDLPAVVIQMTSPGVDPSVSYLPGILLPTEVVVLGQDTGDAWPHYLLGLDRPVDDEVLAATADVIEEFGPGVVQILIDEGPATAGHLGWIALGVGLLGGGAVLAVALALASAESRPDLRTMTAVGASRRTQRSLAAGRALLLSGLAGLLAVPVGMAPVVVAVVGVSQSLRVVVPWLAVAVVSVGVPLVATALAAIAGREPRGALTRAA